jgi:hypothetical protein
MFLGKMNFDFPTLTKESQQAFPQIRVKFSK